MSVYVCTSNVRSVYLFRIYSTSPITWKSNTITWSTNTRTNHLRPVRWHGDLKISAASSTQTMWLESLSVWQMRQGWQQIHRLFLLPVFGLWIPVTLRFILPSLYYNAGGILNGIRQGHLENTLGPRITHMLQMLNRQHWHKYTNYRENFPGQTTWTATVVAL